MRSCTTFQSSRLILTYALVYTHMQDFLLYQLKLVYDRFSSSPCAVPYAQGYNGGLVFTGHGKALVTGMEFADTKGAEEKKEPEDVSNSSTELNTVVQT